MTDIFPTVTKLAAEVGASWPAYAQAIDNTVTAEKLLKNALESVSPDHGMGRLLGPDCSLVLFGSFARYEVVAGSDYDWALLIDGVVDNDHATLAGNIRIAMESAKLIDPGSTGTFGNLVFSHDLVHRIGGGADSNVNLTRRMLMLLESRAVSLSQTDSSDQVWESVLRNILERYFEEDVHFSTTKKVPRFLLNDLTRYWRTIGVDYAAKHRDQEGKKWAARNAKLRFSRKLLYACGLAFCLGCQLKPPKTTNPHLFGTDIDQTSGPFIERAMKFSQTPPLEYIATFIDTFVTNSDKRKTISDNIFGSYNQWLNMWNDKTKRKTLDNLDHSATSSNEVFEEVRSAGSQFARGLESLFFDRDRDEEQDAIAKLTVQYIGF